MSKITPSQQLIITFRLLTASVKELHLTVTYWSLFYWTLTNIHFDCTFVCDCHVYCALDILTVPININTNKLTFNWMPQNLISSPLPLSAKLTNPEREQKE